MIISIAFFMDITGDTLVLVITGILLHLVSRADAAVMLINTN